MKENDDAVGKDGKQEFGGVKTAEPAMFKPIKCRKCNKVMQPQISSEDYILHCQPCRRAVVVSDWDTNAKLFGK